MLPSLADVVCYVILVDVSIIIEHVQINPISIC